MTDGISSADPEELGAFVAAAGRGTASLREQIARLRTAYDEFQRSGSVPVANPELFDRALPRHVADRDELATFTEHVRVALVEADAYAGNGDGVVTMPDARLQARYEQVARRAGHDPAALDGTRSALTVPPAQTGVIPRDSGFVEDPVCTATGHFLEDETDFVMPARLAVLAWPRRYSSRLPVAGPHGRGWFSWATVTIRSVADGALEYRGPDGQVVPFWRETDGWHHGGAINAQLIPVDDGFELRWHADADEAVAAQRWRFDRSGELASIWGPRLGTTNVVRAGGRLVELVHEGGRRLRVVWSGGRIVELSSSDGRSVAYRYNDAGDLAEVVRADGGRRYDCDGHGRIVAVHDADGVRLVHNRYDAEGRVTAQVSPLGRETRFTYSPGLVTHVSDTAGNPATVFSHDERGRVIGLATEGRQLTRRFDERGRVETQAMFDGSTLSRRAVDTGDPGTGAGTGADVVELVGGDGRVQRWHHDAAGRVTGYERAGGRFLRFAYEGDSVLPSKLTGPEGWHLDLVWRDGLVTEVTDADGVRIGLDHDADGCPVAVTNGSGAVTRFEPHRTGRPARIRYADGSEMGLTWDDAGRLTEVRDTAGAVTGFEHTPAGRVTAIIDPAGARTTVEYDAAGVAVRIVDPLGHAVEVRRDQLDQVVGLTNPDGNKWEIDYGTLGVVSLVRAPDGTTWSADHDRAGRLTGITDALGQVMGCDYDAHGEVAAISDAAGARATFAHDEAGNLVERIDPAGGVTRLAWDALDRLLEVTDPDGVRERYTYTPAGRLASAADGEGNTVTYRYDPAGRLTSVTTGSGGTWSFRYDERDRPVESRSPAGRVTRYGYDAAGRRSSVTVGRATWTVEHDPCGRVVATTDPLGAVTRYAYDAAGRMTAVTDPRGNQVRHRYDEVGNLVAVIDAFGRPVTLAYDQLRRPISTTDQLGRTTTVAYDARGRVRWRHLPSGRRIERQVDARGRLLALLAGDSPVATFERDTLGRVTSVDEPSAGRRQSFRWSAAGRLERWSDGTDTLSWDHDDAGRIRRRSGAGDTVTYRYDADGRLAGTASDLIGDVALHRDRDGQVTGLSAAGLERSWERDERGRVVRFEERVAGAAGRSTTIGRDRAGRVVEVVVTGGRTTYEYDPAGQLVGIAGAGGPWSATYDEAGRLVAETTGAGPRTYRYDDAYQLTAVTDPDASVATFEFDADGRRVREQWADGERRYDWDALGRLRAIAHPDGWVIELDVDVLGRLAGVDGMRLVWDPTEPVTRPVRIGDATVHHAADQLIALGGTGAGADAGTGVAGGAGGAGGAVSWFGTDWRGSPLETDAWGRSSPADPEPSFPGFLGEIDLGDLLWLRNRVHDPRTRQYLSPDPLPGVPGTATATSPYHYCGNDPVNWIDPLGLQRAVSIEEYGQLRDRATGAQWGNIVQVATVVATVAVAVAFPGVGLGAAIALGAGMGAVSGGAPVLADGIANGHIDTGAVVRGTLTGAVAGGIGGAIPGGGSLAQSIAKGAAGGAATGAVPELYDLTSLPGADGDFDAGAVATGAIIGGATGPLGRTTSGTAKPARTVEIGDPGPGTFGATDKFGNIVIRPGLSHQDYIETLRHEKVHAMLSPRQGTLMADFRANLRMNGYQNSHILRYTEEALAEGIATRSLAKGLSFPVSLGYTTPRELATEAAKVGAAIGAAGTTGVAFGLAAAELEDR